MTKRGRSLGSLGRTKTMRGKTSVARQRQLGLDRRTPAGMAFPVSPPSEEAFRRHVLAGICPFCGLGPYQVIALHTNRAHSVTANELRELAGLYKGHSITAPDYHERRVAISRSQMDDKPQFREACLIAIHKRRVLSPAARRLQVEKGRLGQAALQAKRREE